MRHTRRNGLVTLMATGGVLALATGSAHADADASGVAAESPGVGSGNAVQLPVHVPVNVCGNTVNVVGLLNPAMGNTCANKGGGGKGGGHDHENTSRSGRGAGGEGAHGNGPGQDGGHGHGHGGGPATHGGGSSNGGGATAEAAAVGSPGVISGNGIQLPVDLPVNVSGNTANVGGIGNPVFGNTSVNVSEPPAEAETPKPEEPMAPPRDDRTVVPPQQDEAAPPAADAGPSEPAAPVAQSGPPVLAQTGSGDVAGALLPTAAGLILAGGLLRRRLRSTADGS